MPETLPEAGHLNSTRIRSMRRWIVCAAKPTSGVRHRFAMVGQVKNFAEHFGYSVCVLWGVSRGVGFCRFQDLFAPIPGVRVENISEEELNRLYTRTTQAKYLKIGNLGFHVVDPAGRVPPGNLFSWDLAGCTALGRLAPKRAPYLVARASAPIRAQSEACIRAYRIADRLGIRVRMSEVPSQRRKPHRVKQELDEVVRSIIRIPWYVRVFVATDSEYIQQMLASHFVNTRFLPKKFDLEEPTGRYVHRQDREAMVTFLRETTCLCACRSVINVGGFLNDGSIRFKMIEEPYASAAFLHLRRK